MLEKFIQIIILMFIMNSSLWGDKSLTQEEFQELINREEAIFDKMGLDKLGFDIQITNRWGSWEDLEGHLPIIDCYVWLSPMSEEEKFYYSSFTTARGGTITHWIIPDETPLTAYPSAEVTPDFYLE